MIAHHQRQAATGAVVDTLGDVFGIGVAVHAPDPAHQRAGMFAQHFIAVEVVTGGHLHGAAQKTFGPGEVQTGAHSRIEEQVVQVIDQRLVAGVQLQLMAWMLLQLGDKVLPGKGLAGIQQGDGPVQAGHFVEQAQHGAPATALPAMMCRVPPGSGCNWS